MATLWEGTTPLVGVEAGGPPCGGVQEAGGPYGHPEGSQSITSGGGCWEPPERPEKKMVAPMAAQNAGKTQLEAGSPPVEVFEKLVVPLAAPCAGKMPPMVVEAGAPSVEVCWKPVAPLADLWVD
jgi:hypothetical protein